MALSFTMMRKYALRKGNILEEEINLSDFKKATMYSLVFGPVMYLTGVALGFIHPYLSFAIYLVIPVYFIFSENKR
jgi:hypothetical protein